MTRLAGFRITTAAVFFCCNHPCHRRHSHRQHHTHHRYVAAIFWVNPDKPVDSADFSLFPLLFLDRAPSSHSRQTSASTGSAMSPQYTFGRRAFPLLARRFGTHWRVNDYPNDRFMTALKTFLK